MFDIEDQFDEQCENTELGKEGRCKLTEYLIDSEDMYKKRNNEKFEKDKQVEKTNQLIHSMEKFKDCFIYTGSK